MSHYSFYCPSLGNTLTLPHRPRRIVSLLASATEALVAMGLAENIVGVCSYSHRYTPCLQAPVVGNYLDAHIPTIQALHPELLLTTTGVQGPFAKKLLQSNLPVFALPLPTSFYGILENQRMLGLLTHHHTAAQKLCETMSQTAQKLKETPRKHQPNLYVELWLGRHMRAVGAGSFITDLLTMAGATLDYYSLSIPQGYWVPDIKGGFNPSCDGYLFFAEPEFPIDPEHLITQRGWEKKPWILSTVSCGENIIQEGPSILQTAQWLAEKITHAFSLKNA